MMVTFSSNKFSIAASGPENSVPARGSKFSVTDKYQDKNIETLESDLKKLMKDDKSHDFNLLRFKLKAIGKDIVNYKKK